MKIIIKESDGVNTENWEKLRVFTLYRKQDNGKKPIPGPSFDNEADAYEFAAKQLRAWEKKEKEDSEDRAEASNDGSLPLREERSKQGSNLAQYGVTHA